MVLSGEIGWKSRAFLLRITVISCLLGAAVVLAVLSYLALSQHNSEQAISSFENTAYSALHALERGFAAKQNGVLSAAKNMAYFKPNESEWPNVVMPGFYDSSVALRRVANLGDVVFMPLVLPVQLPSFESFLRDYFLSDPNIPLNASNIDQYYHGVRALRSTDGPIANRTYHDTTGVTMLFDSPNNILVPLTQLTFTDFFGPESLALNTHSTLEFGGTLDSIIECSQHTSYVEAENCVDISTMITLPLGAPPELVAHAHSVVVQPVYLNQNTSQLVGFIGGGFDWRELLDPLFSLSHDGIDIVVTNGAMSLTFVTQDCGVAYKGYGDLHSAYFDEHEIGGVLFEHQHDSSIDSSYFVHMYPTQGYVEGFKTITPILVSTVLGSFMLLCALAFFYYDRMMRHAARAHEAVLETKRRFVRFISHEIRTPLNAVHLGLEALTAELAKMIDKLLYKQADTCATLLAQRESTDTTLLLATLRGWQELSTEMVGNSECAVDVLNDLLNYDKIEMGTMRLEFAIVPIWTIVESVVAAFVSPAKNKNIHIACDNLLESEQLDNGACLVVGDASRLSQVMRNLISNAIKFTPVNGIISVCVQGVNDGCLDHVSYPEEASHLFRQPRVGTVRISVSDSGVGLTVDQLAQICSEGVQFNANELQAGQGSGLGLFITKGIVEQHGGRLIVASAGIGAGTTFSVELPLFQRPESQGSESKKSHTPRVSEFAPPTLPALFTHYESDSEEVGDVDEAKAIASPKRILVVDDAASNRKMLMRILTSKGYVCEQAEDGQQAIDVYRTSLASGIVFEAIIMDFEMPVMNGPTAARALRDMGCTVPILGVTGNLLPEDVKYFKLQGATDVFGKPLNLARFEEFMRACGAC